MSKSLLGRTKSALADGTIVGDGHTIFDANHYAKHFTQDEIASVTDTWYSDFSSHKSTIFDTKTGKPVETLTGVYNLRFLEWLAGELDVTDYPMMNGRGSQAQVIVTALREKVGAS